MKSLLLCFLFLFFLKGNSISLEDLPHEMKQEILFEACYVELSSFIKLAYVCKDFYKIINTYYPVLSGQEKYLLYFMEETEGKIKKLTNKLGVEYINNLSIFFVDRYLNWEDFKGLKIILENNQIKEESSLSSDSDSDEEVIHKYRKIGRRKDLDKYKNQKFILMIINLFGQGEKVNCISEKFVENIIYDDLFGEEFDLYLLINSGGFNARKLYIDKYIKLPESHYYHKVMNKMLKVPVDDYYGMDLREVFTYNANQR